MSNPIGDRNLLFGILAVQKNIIGPDAFVAAMREWSADKKKGLAQILREQHAITENHHAVLEEIVDQNLAQHGNDAQKCLALVGLAGAARQGLEEIGDADVSAGLAQVPIEAPKPPPKKPAAPAAEVVKPAAAKKPVVKQHAPLPAKPRGMSGWVLLAGGAAVGMIVAVLVAAGVVGALFLGLTLNPAANDTVEPVAQEKPDQVKPKPADKPPVNDRPGELIAVKPSVKEAEEPVIVKPPVADPPEPVAVQPPPAPTPGFTSLFNGKDLTGWKPNPIAPGKWRVENGILVGDGPNAGMLHTTRNDYQDFHLRVEGRFNAPGASSGVLCRSEGGRFGYESLFFAGKLTDGVYVRRRGKTPQIPPAVLSNVQAGDWFTLEFIVQGNRLKVLANGKETADYVDEAKTFASGQIALRQGTGSKLEFRKIEIKERNAVAAQPPALKEADDGFVPLFNGKDLTGWKSNRTRPGDWRVVGGILTGSGMNLRELYTPRDDYGDFHLRLEGRINDDGNGFVVVRYPHGAAELSKMGIGGYAARISSRPAEIGKTGSLYVYDGFGVRTLAFREPLAPAGQWFLLEIIAKENLLVVKVNGQETMSFLNPKDELRGGRIVLGFSDTARKTVMEFRKIEIKEFKAVAAAAPPAPRRLAAWVPLHNGKDLTGWRLEGDGAWKLTPDGDLVGQGPDAALLTNRKDFKNFNVKIEMSASADVDGFLAFRQNPGVAGRWLGLTSRLTGDGALVRAGFAGVDSAKKETGSLVVAFKPGLRFKLEFQVEENAFRAFASGRATGGLNFAPDRHPAGAIGLYLAKGTVRIHHFEIAEELADAPPPVVAGDFVPLFNGKDLTGWKSHRMFLGQWRVENGILIGSAPGMTLVRLHTERPQVKDFHLRLEARSSDKCLGTVGVRSPDGGLPGYNATISSLKPGGIKIGGLHAQTQIKGVVKAADLPSFAEEAIPPGQWFKLEVIAQGEHLIVFVDGKKTTDTVDATFLASGHISLGLFGPETIAFRKIEIKELPPAAAPPVFAGGEFVPLFNGKDLTGWQPHKTFPGAWRVEQGILIGSAPGLAARLHTEHPQYKDFHLRLEARSGDKCLGTVGFRSPDGGLPAYNATITSTQPGGSKVGGLVAQIELLGGVVKGAALPRIAEKVIPPGQWFKLEVIAQGDRLIVLVDGKKTTDTVDANFLAAGYLSLGLVGPETIEFRKIEIKELKPAVAAPPVFAGGDFLPLFNGKDLTGWQPHLKTAANWRVEKGILTGAGEEAGILHTARADYQDFHLRLQARFTVPADADSSSIVCRSPFGRAGYETACADGKFTGGLYLNGKDFGKPVAAKFPAHVASGEWFNLEIVAKGNRLTIKVNGKETSDFVDDENLFKSGHIALRQGAGSKVEIRTIEIRELKPAIAAPPPEPPPANGVFAALFNGKDLTGWQPHAKRPGNWRVENGILIGSAPNGGALYSARNDYQDFHLRAEVRINDKGFGRIFGRAGYDPTKIPFKVVGYEVLLNQRPLGDKTGTLTATSLLSTKMTPARETPTAPGEWFLLELLAKGDLVTVKVNGVAVADFQDAQRQFARTGHIALHQDANAVIEFRKVEIRELPAQRGK